jgi:MFS family permease
MAAGGLDAMVAAVAVRAISEGLHALTQVAWLWVAMLGTPIFGRIGDLLGRKHLLVLGIGLVALGKVVAGLAPSMAVLAVGRGVDGTGWGLVWPTIYALLQQSVPPSRRGRYIVFPSAAGFLGSLLAPALGGMLTGATSILGLPGGRWTFLSQVPPYINTVGLA